MTELDKQVEKIVYDHYDKLVKSVEHIADAWGVKRVPLYMIKDVINKAIVETTATDKRILEFTKKFNQTLHVLKKCCATESKKIGDKKLSIYEFKQMIEILKTSFTESLQNQ